VLFRAETYSNMHFVSDCVKVTSNAETKLNQLYCNYLSLVQKREETLQWKSGTQNEGQRDLHSEKEWKVRAYTNVTGILLTVL